MLSGGYLISFPSGSSDLCVCFGERQRMGQHRGITLDDGIKMTLGLSLYYYSLVIWKVVALLFLCAPVFRQSVGKSPDQGKFYCLCPSGYHEMLLLKV